MKLLIVLFLVRLYAPFNIFKQIEFNEKLHEKYLESFWEEKLLIKKSLLARAKDNLKENEYINWLRL